MRFLMMGAAALALMACSKNEPAAESRDAEMAAEDSPIIEEPMTHTASEELDAVLEMQPDDMKARYQYRHPKETLEFFGVEPGMTVVDTLPGKPGWYGKVLIPYLGPDGKIIGADYPHDLWARIGGNYASDAWQVAHQTWVEDYKVAAEEVGGEGGPAVDAFLYGSAPEALAGTVDVVLIVRASHHFNRFDDAAYFDVALKDIDMLLKPGGIVGVVQHRAKEDRPDDWANGDNGYVKQSRIIEIFENAGFELVGTSEINANPNDTADVGDIVWRLPPVLATSREDDELRAQLQAVGESDRMTLKFKKPE